MLILPRVTSWIFLFTSSPCWLRARDANHILYSPLRAHKYNVFPSFANTIPSGGAVK